MGKARASQGWSASLSKALQDLKAVLNGRVLKASQLKEMLGEAAKVVKGAKDETKELKQLANKEASVAASKRSRSSK